MSLSISVSFEQLIAVECSVDGMWGDFFFKVQRSAKNSGVSPSFWQPGTLPRWKPEFVVGGDFIGRQPEFWIATDSETRQFFHVSGGRKERKRREERKKKKKERKKKKNEREEKKRRKGGKERRKGGKEERKKEREDMKIV